LYLVFYLKLELVFVALDCYSCYEICFACSSIVLGSPVGRNDNVVRFKRVNLNN